MLKTLKSALRSTLRLRKAYRFSVLRSFSVLDALSTSLRIAQTPRASFHGSLPSLPFQHDVMFQLRSLPFPRTGRAVTTCEFLGHQEFLSGSWGVGYWHQFFHGASSCPIHVKVRVIWSVHSLIAGTTFVRRLLVVRTEISIEAWKMTRLFCVVLIQILKASFKNFGVAVELNILLPFRRINEIHVPKNTSWTKQCKLNEFI